jgi:hypothetical protein
VSGFAVVVVVVGVVGVISSDGFKHKKEYYKNSLVTICSFIQRNNF